MNKQELEKCKEHVKKLEETSFPKELIEKLNLKIKEHKDINNFEEFCEIIHELIRERNNRIYKEEQIKKLGVDENVLVELNNLIRFGKVDEVKCITEKYNLYNCFCTDALGFYQSPLLVANENYQFEIIKFMLPYINDKNKLFQVLSNAIENQETDIAKMCIEKKDCDINKIDLHGESFLHVVLHRSRRGINDEDGLVKCLIENGCYINTEDSNGRTPLEIVLSNGYSEVDLKSTLEFMLKNGARVREDRYDSHTLLKKGIIQKKVDHYYDEYKYISNNKVKNIELYAVSLDENKAYAFFKTNKDELYYLDIGNLTYNYNQLDREFMLRQDNMIVIRDDESGGGYQHTVLEEYQYNPKKDTLEIKRKIRKYTPSTHMGIFVIGEQKDTNYSMVETRVKNKIVKCDFFNKENFPKTTRLTNSSNYSKQCCSRWLKK